MKKTSIVIGLGFGDEGKGLTTAYLAMNSTNPLVVRFSGGHQAGHTVVDESGDRHVFSSFGSGALHGVPTFWSRYSTVYPIGMVNEHKSIQKLGHNPKLYVDAMAPVTTPYDIIFNRAIEAVRNRHGSCGIGFGTTIQRSEETPYKLYAQDLLYPYAMKQRLKAIWKYYHDKVAGFKDDKLLEFYNLEFKNFDFDEYNNSITDILNIIEIVHEKDILQKFDSTIFEGSQGILLDMDHGFFPHVTRANTVSKNAQEIISRNNLPKPEIYYITRAYQTRHGNGPMTNEDKTLDLIENPNETNVNNEWQGEFRKSILDIDLINYALTSDGDYTVGSSKKLVISCLDQIPGDIQITINGEVKNFKSAIDLLNSGYINAVKFDQLLLSNSEQSHLIEKIDLGN